ncbi:hypothetical protein BC830DRAFT_1092445 [Chytriomyces sp. MP71]|nr:hypothetical protein BC830DRAFT_1092445 [Chytriomyces sp. MP71]
MIKTSVRVASALRRAHSGPVKSSTKEEWLKIAREWPHEYYSPPAAQDLPSTLTFPEHPDGSETKTGRTESFFTAWHAKALVVVGASYFAVDYLNAAHTKGENPFAKYIADNGATRAQTEKEMAQSLALQQAIADDARILHNSLPKPIHRLMFPDVFSRHSDFIVEPGSQSTATDGDVPIKYSWQRDDDLFGPPYPSKE